MVTTVIGTPKIETTGIMTTDKGGREMVIIVIRTTVNVITEMVTSNKEKADFKRQGNN